MTTTPTAAAQVSGTIKPTALIDAAWQEALKAMRKFPQPNYVISKVAEEAGEVVKAAIHCAEGRETPEAVAGEITQAMAMLMRLYVEGDQVHGLAPIAAIQPEPEPQPVAWRRMNKLGTQSTGVTDTTYYRDLWVREGDEVQPLYATPSSAGTVSVEAALEGAVNWLDALISLIEDTSCDPDDEERFEDVMMGARLWLKNGRAALRALAGDKP